MFFVQILLRGINNDTVSDCSKITSCWLVLVLNVVNKSDEKNFAKSGKL